MARGFSQILRIFADFSFIFVWQRKSILISKQTIARILEEARIEEVVGEFVKLKKSGQNYKGLSPFTTERNPSFYVSPAKGIYKCFSSGKGGNAVSFIMEHEHFSYPEALTYLAKKYGIPIEEDAFSPEETQAESERETLFQVTAFALEFFMKNLHETEAGKAIGLAYFKGRDLKMENITKFQLGYSPDSWDAFTRHALDSGYKLEYLEKTGLTISKEARHYDRFRGRVIFPIHNISGRILGFGGRTLLKEDNVPKYVNSPESEIFNKSQVLYGLYFAKSAIIRQDNCYLVEGYTDVISMHQAGIENVVASSGTALTEEQIRLIKRYTPNVTILYDGDPAGIKASFRGIDMVLEQGMNVRIVLFPDGEDPDSYARKHRRAEVEELITKGAQDFIRFKTSLLLKEAANDPIKRAGLIKEIVGSISLIPDPIYRSVYIKECSSLMEVQEQMLMSSLNKMLYQRDRRRTEQEAARQDVEYPEPVAPRQFDTEDNVIEYIEKYLIYLLLCYGNYMLNFKDEDNNKIEIIAAQYIIDELMSDDIKFSNMIYQKIFEEYKSQFFDSNEIDERYFINHGDSIIANTTSTLLISNYVLAKWEKYSRSVKTERDNIEENIHRAILNLKLKIVEFRIRQISRIINETEGTDDNLIHIHEKRELDKIWLKVRIALGREK
jgi:DNA primase